MTASKTSPSTSSAIRSRTKNDLTPATDEVIYRNKRNYETKRFWETLDGPAFIAAVTRDIPIPGQHLVRYYGAYTNRARGEHRKATGGEPISSAANITQLPNRRSYADFASEREGENHERRAQAIDRGLSLEPHPDAFTPQAESPPPSPEIEITKLPRSAFPRSPRKKWRELILKA